MLNQPKQYIVLSKTIFIVELLSHANMRSPCTLQDRDDNQCVLSGISIPTSKTVKGEGGVNSKNFSGESMELNMKFQGMGGFKGKKTSLGVVWIVLGTTQ